MVPKLGARPVRALGVELSVRFTAKARRLAEQKLGPVSGIGVF
jgi:hypothetical protein